MVLGVSGGIAAYKAVELCRRMVDAGAHVAPVLTRAAQRFVGAQTFSALASEPCRSELFDQADPMPHTFLARRADAVLVAPATADLVARYAHGLADDLLSATLLATEAPVVVAPAMHAEMWRHRAVVDNLALLRARGVQVVEPATGRLAGGDVGPGRLADAADVLAALGKVLGDGALAGRRVLVSAGGTREPIDAVRYVGNRSSGRQGHALAAEAARRGGAVTLVTSSELPVPPGVEGVGVETAAEMSAALDRLGPSADVVVMAAAVADFRPEARPGKLHRGDGRLVLVLEPTEDLLAGLASRRRPGQLLVGFAAEVGDPRAAGAAKLRAKGVDLVVANDVSLVGGGFGSALNEVVVLGPEGVLAEVPLASKEEVAVAVMDVIVERLRGSEA